MLDLVEDLRRRIGSPPRDLADVPAVLARRPEPDEWALESPMLRLWREHQRLLCAGEVTIGYVFMANASLFHPGGWDAPAGLLYTFDPYVLADPRRYEHLSDLVYYNFHRGQRYEDEKAPEGVWLRRVFDDLVSGYETPFAQPLPPTITDGHLVYHGTVVIHRAHLPTHRMVEHFVPILAARDPRDTVATLILPHQLWPEALLERWRRAE